MAYTFELARDTAVINFSAQYCQTEVELLDSLGFERVLSGYLERAKRKDLLIYTYLSDNGRVPLNQIRADLQKICKLLLVLPWHELGENYPQYEKYIIERKQFLEVVETLYNYWRKLGRYAVAYNSTAQAGIQNLQFVETHDRFENTVLGTYRTISEKVMGYQNRVYRQLIAGVNAGLIVTKIQPQLQGALYTPLHKVPMIESVVLHPPFITYPKRNTRKGIFTEVFEHPLADMEMNAQEFFCYPAKVGDLLAYAYFHKDFMAQGVTLCNLFEMADLSEVQTRKPDMVFVYGVKDGKEDTVFYKDAVEGTYVGYVSYCEDIDYFGYMKKMLLTLHNVAMLDDAALPLHGAMASITMKNGDVKNIIIIGDSGAGKSETIEALRTLGDDFIKDVRIVFDDMGVIGRENGQVVAHGTEIGAFVRLDDLETGYAYREIDRSIFMNPNKINARIVIPVATYEEIITRYPIDLFLYANNYSEGEAIAPLTNLTEAVDTFRTGARFAKGTTSEVGLVKTYFANPFGPVQREAQTETLLHDYFVSMQA